MRVGLTGGLGAGKSEVARCFQVFGAYIIDTDALARQAVCPGSDGLRQIARTWPAVVRNGYLDRAALAEIVFHDAQARHRLMEIVHPHVRRLAMEAEQYAKAGQVIVHVVPLLFENGYDRLCDRSVLVTAPEELRIARVLHRDRWTAEQIRSRMASQIDPQQARLQADYVIENDGDFARLKEQALAVYRALTEGLREAPPGISEASSETRG